MKPIGLFYTPKSMVELQNIIGNLPKGDQALVYPYVMMMYNLMVTKMNEQKEEA